jgi:hypothetical protein
MVVGTGAALLVECMVVVRGVKLTVFVGAVVVWTGGRKLLSSWHLVVASGRRWITSAFCGVE